MKSFKQIVIESKKLKLNEIPQNTIEGISNELWEEAYRQCREKFVEMGYSIKSLESTNEFVSIKNMVEAIIEQFNCTDKGVLVSGILSSFKKDNNLF